MPVMMAGRASGTWTSKSTRRSVAPYARAASTTSPGTWRMPRLVRRMSGGRANTMVTIVAETSPMPQKKMKGSMYTKEWTTCMASRIGRTTCQAVSTLPQRMPIGMPTITHRNTETPMNPMVRAVSTQ